MQEKAIEETEKPKKNMSKEWINLAKLRKEQHRFTKNLNLRDVFESTDELKKIGACNVVNSSSTCIVYFAVLNNSMEIIEIKYKVITPKFPHLMNFLDYRESKYILDVYYDLEYDPDIILINRNGIIHPRKCGVATVIGIATNKPTIGVSKGLLFGNVENGKVKHNGKTIGYELVQKKNTTPFYISPGNNISLSTSLNIVKSYIKNHKMPEPIHIANKLATKIRKNIKEKQKLI